MYFGLQSDDTTLGCLFLKKTNSTASSKHGETEATVRLLFCTLINATLQILYANNSLLNWYWVRLLEQNQKIMITVYALSFCK